MPNVNIPAPRVPFIEQRTGLMAREWFLFLSSLGQAAGDGDKGDVTISNFGTTFTINDGAVDTDALGGDITAYIKTLLDDATALEARTTLLVSAPNTPYTPANELVWPGGIAPTEAAQALDLLIEQIYTLKNAPSEASTFVTLAKWGLD